MKQNKIYLSAFIFVCLMGVSACTPSKPPLEPTQIINGRSIIVPPEFFVLPKALPVQDQKQPDNGNTDTESE